MPLERPPLDVEGLDEHCRHERLDDDVEEVV